MIDYDVAQDHQIIVPRRPAGNFKKLIAAIAELAVAIHSRIVAYMYTTIISYVVKQQIANDATHTANFPAAK